MFTNPSLQTHHHPAEQHQRILLRLCGGIWTQVLAGLITGIYVGAKPKSSTLAEPWKLDYGDWEEMRRNEPKQLNTRINIQTQTLPKTHMLTQIHKHRHTHRHTCQTAHVLILLTFISSLLNQRDCIPWGDEWKPEGVSSDRSNKKGQRIHWMQGLLLDYQTFTLICTSFSTGLHTMFWGFIHQRLRKDDSWRKWSQTGERQQ